MVAPNSTQTIQELPLGLVGGNTFGRFSKISVAQTWNFLVSDGFLVPYAGYVNALSVGSPNIGRGIYASTRVPLMMAVFGQDVYRINSNLSLFSATPIGQLATGTSDVYMAENNNNEILITDGSYIYVYNYGTGIFYSSAPGAANTVTFPYEASGYCAFQNSRFIIAVNGTQQWVLSELNNGLSWPEESAYIGLLQGKPGFIEAVVPMPGGGNNIMIFGSNVTESWQDVGAALFPYQRNSTFNVDYGCLTPSSIAELENFVVWLGVNEQTGPVIMYTQGSGIQTISTDGINYKFSQLTNPNNCTAFLFKQDGHLIYQITFPDDNLSYAYDFGSQLFFTVSDESLNYHPARQVVFFNNDYYFVSLKGSNVYRFGTQYTYASYEDDVPQIIPRIRVVPPVRMPSQRYFIAKSLGFTIENGQFNRVTTTRSGNGHDGDEITTEDSFLLLTEDSNIITTENNSHASEQAYETFSEVVDLSISRDGGESFGSSARLPLNRIGKRKSRFIWQRLGIVNDATFQLRFSGYGRFVVGPEGVLEVWQ